jgi:hypothetical protein
MTEQCDYKEHSILYQIREARPIEAALRDWGTAGRLVPINTGREEGVVRALVLDTSPVFTATAGPGGGGPLAGHLLIAEGIVRLWGSVKERFDRIRAEFEQKAGPGLSEGHSQLAMPQWGDVVAEALFFPAGVTDQTEAERRIDTYARQFFEGTWLQRPLKSLSAIAPLDAAGHAVIRRKLRGVIQFLQDCAAGGLLHSYDFDRVRRKLGLVDTGPVASGAAPLDITALAAPDLAALKVETLSDEQLRQAFQTAQRLDAHEIGTRFARALVGRPPVGDADRYPYFSYLIERELSAGDTAAALDTLNEAEKVDCEQNDGRRRNDYELRRGKLHARRGEADQANDVFERLIQRDPTNMKLHVAAAEAMLSLRQGKRALHFAEGGLAHARKQNDRDSEGHLMELVAAAKKQGG